MLRSISLYLGIFSILISFFSLLNIIYSQYLEFYLNLNSYLYTLIISFFLGIGFILYQSKKQNKINLYEKLLIILFGFFYFPFLIAIPYYLSIYNLSFIDCYFEAVSGFTSTGFTIFNNIKYIDESMIIWRSTSQWLGGLFFLFSLILLLDELAFKLKNFITTFISINLVEIKKQFLKVFVIYVLLTLIIFLLLSFSGIRIFDSFNLSMTVISSGGFIPSNSLEEIISTNNQIFVLSITMLFSFFNLYLLYNLISFKNKIDLFQEDILLFFYLLFLILISFIFINDLKSYQSLFLSLVSSISNIGIGLNNSPNNLSIFFLFLTIIGGGLFSTSSGMRFIKFILLIKFSFNELFLVARPKYILSSNLFFSNLKIKSDEVNKYFLSFLFFIILLLVLSSFLSFYGIYFQEALSISILTLTNTVNSSIYNLDNFDFNYLSNLPKILLIFFMIIGRVEILTILVLVKKFFFKN